MLSGLRIVSQLHFSREFHCFVLSFFEMVDMAEVLGLSMLKLSSVLGAHMKNQRLKAWRISC